MSARCCNPRQITGAPGCPSPPRPPHVYPQAPLQTLRAFQPPVLDPTSTLQRPMIHLDPPPPSHPPQSFARRLKRLRLHRRQQHPFQPFLPVPRLLRIHRPYLHRRQRFPLRRPQPDRRIAHLQPRGPFRVAPPSPRWHLLATLPPPPPPTHLLPLPHRLITPQPPHALLRLDRQFLAPLPLPRLRRVPRPTL